MLRHLMSEAHEPIDEITSGDVCYLSKPQSRGKFRQKTFITWKNCRNCLNRFFPFFLDITTERVPSKVPLNTLLKRVAFFPKKKT